MSETWKRWEGRSVDGRFPLQSYLGGSDHSAVFLTLTQGGVGDSKKVAIKLIPADPADAEKQLLRLKAVGELNNLNLIRIFEAGRCELDGAKLLYIVEEYAEEDLSEVLPERALTAGEAREMLRPILRALQCVHDKGFVHGHIQPSNILAIGDQVKLSSDTLGVPGERSRSERAAGAYDPPEAAAGPISTAADVWQLGVILVEALTQHLPVWDCARQSAPEVSAAVPEPFREIARHCLQVDAGKRWTIGEILDRLGAERLETNCQGSERVESTRPAPTSAQTSAAAISGQQKQSAKWPYLLGLAAVVAVALVLIARPKPSGLPAEMQSTHVQQGAAAENSQSAQASTQQEPKLSPAAPGNAKVRGAKVEGATPEAGGDEKASTNTDTTNNDNQGGVVRQVMPQVLPGARRTIQGKIKVGVKVKVDAAGDVSQATLESPGPSRYFSRVALEAAWGWKFSPAQSGEQPIVREWKLQFAFSRARTEVSAVRTKR
ncbi:MAG: TonB family protein [Terriglobales bacterium]|jgi:TonB family protein